MADIDEMENEEVVENETQEQEEEVLEQETDAEETESEENEESSGEAKPSTQESRGLTRQAKLANQLKAEREARIRAEALAEERANVRTTAPAADPEVARRQREERLALMDPEERREYVHQEQLQNLHNQVLLTQLQTQDALDKSEYSMKSASNPVYAKYSSEVEKRLASERQAGRNWSRETILAQVLGEQALKAKPNTKKKEEAQERVNASKGKPISGRSNTTTYRPGRGGESLDDLESRLENVIF